MPHFKIGKSYLLSDFFFLESPLIFFQGKNAKICPINALASKFIVAKIYLWTTIAGLS
jgi:hypothetical protein